MTGGRAGVKVFVAGATGALGQRTIPALQRAGHEVIALTRDAASTGTLARHGARPVVGNIFDRDELVRLLEHDRPDVVVHAAKAIPRRGPLRYRDMQATNRLHRDGTRNLLDAAIRAGSTRYIAESVVFAYGYGRLSPPTLTEHAPTDRRLRPRLDVIHDAVVSMEDQALDAHASGLIESVVLRFGIYYGPGASDRLRSMLRWRLVPVPHAPEARWPLVHVDDAAAAVVAALTGPTGRAYNIVDDHAANPGDFLAELALRSRGRRPPQLPPRLLRPVVPYYVDMATSTLVVDNHEAKDVLRWRPQHPTYQHGLDAWLGDPRRRRRFSRRRLRCSPDPNTLERAVDARR